MRKSSGEKREEEERVYDDGALISFYVRTLYRVCVWHLFLVVLFLRLSIKIPKVSVL